MIRVGKYDFDGKKMPSIDGFENLLIHVRDTLSPYVLKSEDGCIMENIWQFSKIFEIVTEQKQTIHRWTREKGWHYKRERHMNEDGLHCAGHNEVLKNDVVRIDY
jgi:hypothetical protein